MTRDLSPRELEVVAAWWHTGSVKEAARLLGMAEQTAKNDLRTARLRSGALTTLALARLYSGRLPSLLTLRRLARKAKVT